jgi:hypothetical protein
MSPAEYQVALIQLLAEIDQQAAAELDAAYDPELTRDEREIAVMRLEFRRRAAAEVERMLNAARLSRER